MRPRIVPSQLLSVLQLNPAAVAPTLGEVIRLVQKLLPLLPLKPCQSKSPSRPNTKTSVCRLPPIVTPTRPPLVLKSPLDVLPDGLSGSLHWLWPNPKPPLIPP